MSVDVELLRSVLKRVAAEVATLPGVPRAHASIDLGVVPVEVVHEIAKAFGVPVGVRVHAAMVTDGGPWVIEVARVVVGAVEMRVQSKDRAATEEECAVLEATPPLRVGHAADLR